MASGPPPTGPSRGKRRLALGLVAILVVLAVLTVASVMLGARSLPARTVWDALFHFDPDNSRHLAVRSLRLPRTAVGLLAGAALGLAGVVMQGLTRNPLADPGLLGVNSGAALGVVLGINVFGVTALSGYVWFALAGAAVAAAVVYAVSSLGGAGVTPLKLALGGVALTAVLSSATNAVLLLDVGTFDQFRFWQVGSLAGRDEDVVAQAAPFVAVGALVALALARSLDALALGDDLATALGRRVGRVRLTGAVAVVLLCGAATAMAGPIGFVGLTVPHAVRLLTGPGHRWLLPYSMLAAPALLLLADIAGRLVIRPGELQVGIVTAAIGAPFFMALARRRRMGAL
ncbi:FecCD family ABC transporter permease [Streptomyces caatingaensis]|uniref:Iron ABC transporter permease n=1 Tax=Streptomyces caatingaensis TaxID=1678637 RepID=A0A0K9XAW4_9ACTN|nr:iron chelate uptake ABC transporter family permease subunit [Streptomyces caatingaensis]KNB49792.1 iron ABC transporter permease [Streptomyces caatingaensis]